MLLMESERLGRDRRMKIPRSSRSCRRTMQVRVAISSNTVPNSPLFEGNEGQRGGG